MRLRRESSSSIETVGDGDVRWRQETSVVKTVSKGMSSDDWPIFELQDAIILNRNGKTVENALEVLTGGPFIVRGKLVIDEPSQKQHLMVRVRRFASIEIRQSILYSIGETVSETEDTIPVIWVSGRGGWYEIKPSDRYREMYSKMCEGVTLYYTIMDIYISHGIKKLRIQGKKHELDNVLLKYVATIGDPSILEDIKARCRDHARFLISQFAQEDPDTIDWPKTAFYKWLVAEHSEILQKTEAAIKNPPSLTRSTSVLKIDDSDSDSKQNLRSPSVQVTDGHDFPIRSRMSRSHSSLKENNTIQTQAFDSDDDVPDEPPPSHASTLDPFTSVLIAIEDCYSEIRDSKRASSASGLLNKLYFGYKFPSYRGKGSTQAAHKIPVEEVIHYNAKELLKSLSKKDHSEIYSWLQQLAATPFTPVALKLSDFPFTVHPRESRPFMLRKPDAKPLVKSPIQTPPRVGKGLKTPGRSTKSGLKPIKSSKKRLSNVLDSDDDDDESQDPARKKSHYSSDSDSLMEDATIQNNIDDAEREQSSPCPPHTETARVVIHSEPIPSTTSHGLDGAWTCPQTGCGYIIREDDEEESQKSIKEHFEQHQRDDVRVELAVAESRGHLPINHLLDKIRKLGEKSQQDSKQIIDGVQVPEPIKRRLLV